MKPGCRRASCRSRSATGFFLANLAGAAERSETFEADLYLTFRWHDPRLAFTGTEPKRFLEEAAVEQLQTMWWPQLEFINTGTPDVANRTLDIAPDGSVTYKLSVTATFRVRPGPPAIPV